MIVATLGTRNSPGKRRSPSSQSTSHATVTALLDAAVALVEIDIDIGRVAPCVFEEAFNLSTQCRLVGLDGEKIAGACVLDRGRDRSIGAMAPMETSARPRCPCPSLARRLPEKHGIARFPLLFASTASWLRARAGSSWQAKAEARCKACRPPRPCVQTHSDQPVCAPYVSAGALANAADSLYSFLRRFRHHAHSDLVQT
jgi:hypothetical protein